MDLSSPMRSVIPSAHGAVLTVLARAGEPLSGRKVAELTNALVSASPNAVKACKTLLQDVAGADINAALIAHTVQGIASIRASHEGKEGVQSFLQKRKPNWLN